VNANEPAFSLNFKAGSRPKSSISSAKNTSGYEIEIHHRGPTAPYPLADTLKRLKGRTARRCNLALGRSGPFWHHESYDHIVRNQQEYERIVAYILNNPVKAGLVENCEDWKFSFVAW
jgi:hypothetical protein